MEHYNDVARTLMERPDDYGPLFAVDERHNEILWELWISGFEKAVKLRPAAWRRLLAADAETAQAISGLLTLADVDRRDPRFSEEQLNALTTAATRSAHGSSRLTKRDWPTTRRFGPRHPPNLSPPKSAAMNLVPAAPVKNTKSAAV
jgi:hypothetical protein